MIFGNRIQIIIYQWQPRLQIFLNMLICLSQRTSLIVWSYFRFRFHSIRNTQLRRSGSRIIMHTEKICQNEMRIGTTQQCLSFICIHINRIPCFFYFLKHLISSSYGIIMSIPQHFWRIIRFNGYIFPQISFFLLLPYQIITDTIIHCIIR